MTVIPEEGGAGRDEVTVLATRRRRAEPPSALTCRPEDPFPGHLTRLPTTDLQVLHSRLCWQLDQEYLTAPDGPDPVTLDRHQEVTAEMKRRHRPSVPPRVIR